ncbi:hypothetical protein HYW73_00875 [Candidatus Nomurabacteria bacterium]|nr:hypothetical protein [Candidatus Nomurabacteria bacterium]
MFSRLKKHFIPHAGNNHRPHILRDRSTCNIIAVVIFLEIFTFLIPAIANINLSGGMAAILPAVLGELTNQERQSQNLAVLSVNPVLTRAAEMKAEDMADKGYFAHTSPEGITPWYWIELAGYEYQYAGENLAVNFRDSKDVTIAWLNSPTHKANIVKGNYTEMGTGIAKGIYKGRNTVFVAQVYANPAPVVLPQKAPVVAQVPAEKVVPAPKAPVATAKPADVLGAEAESKVLQEPAFWQKLRASPRNTTNIFFAIIFSVIAFTLLLYVIIKRREHHLDLVTNGFAVIAIIGAIFVANYQYSYQSMVITQSLDYSVESK